MNVVTVIGNVASEPEMRYTSGGKAVCSFRVAVSRPGSDGADFFTVVAWERQAEICRDYLHIGRKVAAEGRLHHTTWEHEGKRRSNVEIVASRVELLGGKPRADRQTGADASTQGDATAERDATTDELREVMEAEPQPVGASRSEHDAAFAIV